MGRVQVVKEIFTEKKVNSSTFAWEDVPTTLVTKAYAYDENGNIVKELDGEGFLGGTGTTDAAKIQSGYGTITTYNAANLPSTVLDPVGAERGLKWTTKYGYDGAGRQISATNAKGVVSGTRYDDAARVIATTVREKATAPEKVLKTNTYDLAGRLISVTDANGNQTTYENNAFGQVRSANDPGDDTIAAFTQTNQYDVMGRLAQKADSTGAVQLYTYDAEGHTLSETEQQANGKNGITTSTLYDKNGNERFVTDGNGHVTSYTYDALNRQISSSVVVTDVQGTSNTHTTQTQYDANGNVLWTQDWLGNRQTSIYDERNHLIATVDATGTTIEKIEYNASDAQVSSYDALNHVTRYTFDRDNRQLTATDPDGNVTSQTYDNVGQNDSKTDGNGNVTTYAYDAMDRLLSVTNALGEVTSYTYDANGNKLTQRDGNGHITTYEYNVANKLIRQIDHGGRTGTAGQYTYDSAKVESYTYTADGQLQTKLDRNGHTTTYVYDVHGQMLSQTVTGADVTTPEKDNQISYTYDNNGNQLSMTDGTGTTRRTYDELNRVIAKSVPGMGTNTYQEDVTTDLPDGYVAEVTTDVKGNVTTKIYDQAGRLYQVKDGNEKPTTYTYYADGSQKSVTNPSGSAEQYVYYNNKQLKTLTNYQGTTLLDTYTYTYDQAGNQLTKDEVVNGVSKGTTTYGYDALNRLQSVKEPSGKKTEYTFDGAGNRLTEETTEGTTISLLTYTYNEQNRLLSTTEVKTTGETDQVKYTYDNNGNLINKSTETRKKIDPENLPTPTFGIFVYGQPNPNERIDSVLAGIAHYEYNVFNELVKTTTGSSTDTYAYNGDGLRVQKTVNGVTTHYMYEYDKVVLETGGNGQQTARNLYGVSLISRTVGADRYTYLYNGHADVTALVDSNGTIQGTYTYDAFGNLTSQTGTINNPIRYSGYQYDDENGLYYLNARYYDPKIARFLSEDTYRGEPNDPLSLNLYTYVQNEPIKYKDPTGHKSTADDGTGSWAIKTSSGSQFSYTTSTQKSGNTTTKTTTTKTPTAKSTTKTVTTKNTTSITAKSTSTTTVKVGNVTTIKTTSSTTTTVIKPALTQSVQTTKPSATTNNKPTSQVDMKPDQNSINISGIVDIWKNVATNSWDQASGYVQSNVDAFIEVNSSLPSALDYWTLGISSDVEGTFNPEQPLSLQHWVDSTETALIVVAPFERFLVDTSAEVITGAEAALAKGAGKVLTSADDVANYISKNGKLPDNFITKKEAEALGWDPKKGNLNDVAPGKSIGGDVFNNRGNPLPTAPGRVWYEADTNYSSGFRGSERIIYSNDGLIYQTTDHYTTFTKIK